MFGLFKKKDIPEFNFSVIGTDMHSHILPGIDDGAQYLKDSIAMVRKFQELGFTKLIATPHIMADYFRNTPERISRSLNILLTELEKEGIDMPISAAAEYYLDETFGNKIKNKELLTFGDNKILFELSYINMPHNLDETILSLKDAGYNPILAHPERYPYFQSNLEAYHRIQELGCSMQLNTISLAGYYGKHVKKAAEYILENRLLDFIGSDMHHLRHAEALKNSLDIKELQNILRDNFLQNSTL